MGVTESRIRSERLQQQANAVSQAASDTSRGPVHFPEAFESVDHSDDAQFVRYSILLTSLNPDRLTAGLGNLTHFALRLDRHDGVPWILERTAMELLYAPAYDAFFETRQQRDGEASLMSAECEVSCRDVKEFVIKQREHPYSFIRNNCKHLVFNFFVDVVKDRSRWTIGLNYSKFCGSVQCEYMKRYWLADTGSRGDSLSALGVPSASGETS